MDVKSEVASVPAGATVARRTIERWGDKTVIVPSVLVAVQNVATRIVLANPRRVWLLVANVDVGDVFVDFSAAVSNPQGIQLSPKMGFIELNMDEDGEMCTREVWGLAPNGPYNVYVIEQTTL